MYVYVCVYVCIYMCVCVYVCVYVFVYIYSFELWTSAYIDLNSEPKEGSTVKVNKKSTQSLKCDQNWSDSPVAPPAVS
jgi:hypothetical protein